MSLRISHKVRGISCVPPLPPGEGGGEGVFELEGGVEMPRTLTLTLSRWEREPERSLATPLGMTVSPEVVRS